MDYLPGQGAASPDAAIGLPLMNTLAEPGHKRGAARAGAAHRRTFSRARSGGTGTFTCTSASALASTNSAMPVMMSLS